MKTISVRLSEEHIEFLKAIGDGRLTKGVRVLCDYVVLNEIAAKVKKESKKFNLGKL